MAVVGVEVIMVAILAATSSSTGARHLRSCNNKRLLVDVKRLQMNHNHAKLKLLEKILKITIKTEA